MYTQSLFVLTTGYLSPDEIAGQLRRMSLGKRIVPPPSEHWSRMTEGWHLRPGYCENAHLTIDSVAHPWPSDTLFRESRPILIAQRMGSFGPHIDEQSWTRARDGTDTSCLAEIDNHTGFVRLRMSYQPNLDSGQREQTVLHLQALASMLRAVYFLLEHPLATGLYMPAADRFMLPRELWRTYDGTFGEMENMWTIWTRLRVHCQKDGSSVITVRGLKQIGVSDFDMDGGLEPLDVVRARVHELIKQACQASTSGLSPALLAQQGLVVINDDVDGTSSTVLRLRYAASSSNSA